MILPENLKYSKEHEWIRIESDKSENGKTVAYIGVTDFAQSELGELVYVEVFSVGDTLEKDEVFGTVEAVKTTSDLFMPVGGTVLEFNSKIDEEEGDNAGLINEDPYGDGWIVKIEVSNDSELEDLLSPSAYEGLLA